MKAWVLPTAIIFMSIPSFPFKRKERDLPGGPVGKTSPSKAGSTGSIPGWGAKIPRASRPKNQNVKQKQYCNKFNQDFKNGPHPKKFKK